MLYNNIYIYIVCCTLSIMSLSLYIYIYGCRIVFDGFCKILLLEVFMVTMVVCNDGSFKVG